MTFNGNIMNYTFMCYVMCECVSLCSWLSLYFDSTSHRHFRPWTWCWPWPKSTKYTGLGIDGCAL